jgi:hypothetical protein
MWDEVAMQKWEYLYLNVHHLDDNRLKIATKPITILPDVHFPADIKSAELGSSEFFKFLNQLGSVGWEMVSRSSEGTHEVFYFKRTIT